MGDTLPMKDIFDELRNLQHNGRTSLLRCIGMEAADEISSLRAELAELRDWIRQEGVNSDTCTYNILREVCEGCNCKRRPLPPAPTTTEKK